MSEVKPFEFKKEAGYPKYSVVNDKLGLTMDVEPMLYLPEGETHPVRRKDAIEITFNGEQSKEFPLGWSMLYIITTDDIGVIDMSDNSFVEEALSKYKDKFLSLERFEFTERGENWIKGERLFFETIFPDIEEKRKERQRKANLDVDKAI